MAEVRGTARPAADFLGGGGELGALMRAKRWQETPLGLPATWSPSLKTVIRIMLSSRYAMWMGWGADLTMFYNDAYRPTLGVKHQWALGASAREVWAEIWPDIGPRIERVLHTGESTWDEDLMLLLERSGYPEETYHTFSYSPLADETGRAVGMLCVVTEETKRVIGERRLTNLRELAAEIPAYNTRADVLEAAHRQLERSTRDLPFTLTYLFDDTGRANLAGRSGFDFEHPIAPHVVEPHKSGQTWPLEQLLKRRTVMTVSDLSERFTGLPRGVWDKPPHQAVVAPIAQQGHEAPAGFLVAGINPYLRADEDYLGYINLIAGQLASGLANAQAHEAARRRADALAELDLAKTAFFSNVSHEFRTPLTLMLGPLEDLLRTPGEERLDSHRQLVQIAHRNGVRLLKLVNTLLDFSRMEAGRVQANFEAADLADYTAELASTFRAAVEAAGLKLEVHSRPLGRPVFVDRDMWEKIVLNLLSNAFKFTFHGTISVGVEPAADREQVEVTVRDTGTGIAADELPHLFDRFRRVEGARGRSIEGSGIGLALVQELVKAHGGSIRVTSTPGQGSAFTVSLPFAQDPLPADRAERATPPPPSDSRRRAYLDEAQGWLSDSSATGEVPALATPAPEGHPAVVGSALAGRRVLLADDNTDMRTYLTKLLEASGLTVEAVNNGEQALEAARREQPDLVLSDVMMPRLDGFQLLAALRADPALAEVPVLLLSARAGEVAKVEGLAAGANDYLVKPFSARELIARVRANLEIDGMRRRSQAVLREANESLERQVAARTADIRAKEARLRAIFSTSYVHQAFLDRDGVLLDANATSLAAIQASLQDIIGHKFWETPWFNATPEVAGVLREAVPRVAAGAAFRQELRLSLPQSGWHWFDLQMRPVRDRDGRVVAIMPEAVDITERRAAEEALRQAQKMEGIGHLTGGVAHDFNNLLTIIIGSLETLRRQLSQPTPDPGALERALDSATRGAQRAASLTQRLLAFSRQQPLDPKPVDLSGLVSGMSDLLRRTLGEQVAIETVLAEDLYPALIDSNQLEIAIINLAVNARDAMPAGGTLTVETGNAELDENYTATHADVVPGQYVRLAVTDTGAGMTPETLSKAFEPFFTTKDVGHGTGLGLSQVYGFVKQSGGHVNIHSELRFGTSVTLYFPRGDTREAFAAPEPNPVVVQSRGHETLLAVEDDPDVRAHSVGILRELGYQVYEAPSGRIALEILAAHPEIELLFSDVGLPGGMNGRQLAERALHLRPRLKVLFTSGYARDAIVHDGRLDAGVQLITKPFSFAALAGKLREVLGSPSRNLRILIVEDEELIRSLMVDHLEQLGFEVQTAGTAAEARQKMASLKSAVDALVVDVGLPDGRGDALVSEIRALHPALPVVIASGYDRATVLRHFAGQQGIEFLHKPFTLDELQDALQRIGVSPLPASS